MVMSVLGGWMVRLRAWRGALRQELVRRERAYAELELRHSGLTRVLEDERAIRAALARRLADVQRGDAQQPGRYAAALVNARVLDATMTRVETMAVGVYQRDTQLLVTDKPLTDEQVAGGWQLLNTEQALCALCARQAMTMGVWN